MFSKPSGCQNRKRKAKSLKEAEASAKLLCKYLSKPQNPVSSTENVATNDVALTDEPKLSEKDEHSKGQELQLPECRDSLQTETGIHEIATNIADETCQGQEPVTVTHSLEEQENGGPSSADVDVTVSFPLKDPATWPTHLNPNDHDCIIAEGPFSPYLERYPKDGTKRSFSNVFYYRLAPNGEKVKRRWLLYSQQNNSVYCFCCKIFSTARSNKTLSDQSGNCDWRHIGTILTRHETSPNHLKCYERWVEAERRLSTGKTIDDENQKIIAQEKERWQNVLKRLLAITQFLAQHQMAFRGRNETLYKKDNGNYLGLVELIAQFDPVMKEHICRVLANEKQRCLSYLGKNIQNELLTLMGDKVREEILSRIKGAKYYALILDCTPDLSRKEQFSVVLRYVYETKEKKVEICESFLDFFEITDTSGKGMSETVLKKLQEYDLDISNCRGQGYDNGANMKGKHSGLQKQILEKNKRAFFVPCGCHSLNLVLSDPAKTSVPTVTLFGTIQRLFVFFSSSTKRWSKLLESLSQSYKASSVFGPSLTLKELCVTRWEARIESLKAVRYQIVQIRQALWDLHEDASFEDEVRSEANSLSETIEDFGFLVSLTAWYDVLFQINIASKILQSKIVNLPQAVAILKSVGDFLTDFRENGFVSCLVKAKELAEDLEVEGKFKTPRVRRKKKQFDYEANDEAPIDPQERFRVDFFIPLVETAQMAVQERFEQLKAKMSKVEFLFKLDELPKREDLFVKCKDLEDLLSDGDDSDIKGAELCEELISIKDLMPNKGTFYFYVLAIQNLSS